VGMNHTGSSSRQPRRRVPHMRGDEPQFAGEIVLAPPSSPHAWG